MSTNFPRAGKPVHFISVRKLLLKDILQELKENAELIEGEWGLGDEVMYPDVYHQLKTLLEAQ